MAFDVPAHLSFASVRIASHFPRTRHLESSTSRCSCSFGSPLTSSRACCECSSHEPGGGRPLQVRDHRGRAGRSEAGGVEHERDRVRSSVCGGASLSVRSRAGREHHRPRPIRTAVVASVQLRRGGRRRRNDSTSGACGAGSHSEETRGHASAPSQQVVGPRPRRALLEITPRPVRRCSCGLRSGGIFDRPRLGFLSRWTRNWRVSADAGDSRGQTG